MDELTRVLEQARSLRAAFDAGVIWTVQGPGDEHAVQEHQPLVAGLQRDYVFFVQELRGRPCVVVAFGLDGGPAGLRWLHRFEPPSPDVERTEPLAWFQEGVECGWIARSLARVTPGTSPVWTDFSWGHPSRRWSEAMQLFADDRLDLAADLLRGQGAGLEEQSQAERITALQLAEDTSAAREQRERIWRVFRKRQRAMNRADRAATAAFLQEHHRADGSWSPAWS